MVSDGHTLNTSSSNCFRDNWYYTIIDVASTKPLTYKVKERGEGRCKHEYANGTYEYCRYFEEEWKAGDGIILVSDNVCDWTYEVKSGSIMGVSGGNSNIWFIIGGVFEVLVCLGGIFFCRNGEFRQL